MPLIKEKPNKDDLRAKMETFFHSTQKELLEIQFFMDKWKDSMALQDSLLSTQMLLLKNLEDANEHMEDTVLDVLVLMHHYDLIKAVSPCKCQLKAIKKPTRNKKHG